MKIDNLIYLFLLFISNLGASCHETPKDVVNLTRCPIIFPDYQNIIIPPNIAPLNFKVLDSAESVVIEYTSKIQKQAFKFKGNSINIPNEKWRQILRNALGDSLKVTVFSKMNKRWYKYLSFYYIIAPEPIDPYLIYRLILPGYQTWNEMGIYQRNIETFEQKEILTSKLLPGTCMNCHSFSNNNPDNMLIHLREVNNGTLLIQEDKIQYLKTKTDSTFGNAAFPQWSPNSRYIAFSIDKVVQIFHSATVNRAEALDLKSDIVIYDIERNELITTDKLFSPGAFEIYPSFSADGKTLFFCSAEAKKLPDEYKQVKYSLCAISFDPEKREFGINVDTLVSAKETGKSATFPRVSPDGKHIIFCMSEYGHSPAYRPDADLFIYDIQSRKFNALELLNSENVESYHSWSSSSRWIVFSSRRIDGLYMYPFIAYIDKDGNPNKPFLLPQKEPDFYKSFLFSFNIPEMSIKEVKINRNSIEEIIANPQKTVKFRRIKNDE